jgi:hypothetical protein
MIEVVRHETKARREQLKAVKRTKKTSTVNEFREHQNNKRMSSKSTVLLLRPLDPISYFSRREISRQKNRPIRTQQAYRHYRAIDKPSNHY